MSWQVAAFMILALALTGGFAWYELTKPDARLVAMIGTLAALAALGRIAFAAVPNVKPTTDIVLISGYALGGAPGFVVGALAGLASNFFFGQGPWTPWQMAGWGVTGLIGAGIAVMSPRGISRWPLAAACAITGFGFTALQDVGDWVTYSDHSSAQLGVYVGKGAGFDLVHAAGCLAFALAFGPAMARSVRRFGARMQVTWGSAGIVPLLLAGLLLGGAALAQPARAATPAGYLLAAQNTDGGFGPAPGTPSSPLYSGWAALGLAALGHNPLDIRHGGASAFAYVRTGASSSSDVGGIERTILALRAAGASASDLVGTLQAHIRSDGSVADQVNLTAFAVLALRAAGIAAPSRMLGWLAVQQDSDGGFNFARGGGTSDVDDTGAALQALAGGGSSGRVRGRALGFLRRSQNGDGGFPQMPGDDSNAQSTAWAVQGLIAAGVDPAALAHGSPLSFLRSLTAADGHVRYSRASDQTPVWVTAQAALALAGKALPVGAVARRGGAGGAGAPAAKRAHRQHGTGRHPGKHLRIQVPAGLLRYATDAGIATALVLAPVS